MHNLFLVYLSVSTLFCVDDYAGCTLHTSHPHRITSTKCYLNTVVSPDDGHIVTRNM